MNPSVHANRVARTGFNAVPAKNTPQLVDDEALGKTLVSAPRVARWILPGFDIDALSWAYRGTAQAGDTARRVILAMRQPMHASKTLRVGPALLGVADGVDSFFHCF